MSQIELETSVSARNPYIKYLFDYFYQWISLIYFSTITLIFRNKLYSENCTTKAYFNPISHYNLKSKKNKIDVLGFKKIYIWEPGFWEKISFNICMYE